MPGKRAYLPSGLTAKEKRNPKLKRKLSHCVKKVEKQACPKSSKRSDGKYDYKKCRYNPVAVCRAALER